LQSKKKLPGEKQGETHCLSNNEKEKWIEDYVARGTTGVRKQVEDGEAAIRQEQEDTEAAENTGLAITEAEKTVHEKMVVTGDRLSDIANSDDGEDLEDTDD
jgi:hypothetical protein